MADDKGAHAGLPDLVDIQDPSAGDSHKVKPALKHGDGKKKKTKKATLKWDEAKIQEHDQLRGTRMKIEEPDTPYHHYDSGSETDGSHHSANNPNATEAGEICWNHLSNKLNAAAAARDAFPSSPSSSHGEENAQTEEERRRELKALEFKEHRKRHYNEMELVRKFRAQHQHGLLDDEDEDEEEDNHHDADDEA